MTRGVQSFLIGWFGLAALASIADADILHLVRGGRIEGVLTSETAAAITMDVGMGKVSVPRSTVLRIERKDSALSEYRARLSALAPADLTSLADLARFAADHGLRSEARTLWARAVSLSPGNVEAHLALGHVLVGGAYVDEEEAFRANGFVRFEGRWMSPAEQASLLREREQRTADQREIETARRSEREALARARRAEAEAASARSEAARSPAYPPWGYGGPVIVDPTRWGGYGSGCQGASCTTTPPTWPAPPPSPRPTPIPRAPPLHPSSIR